LQRIFAVIILHCGETIKNVSAGSTVWVVTYNSAAVAVAAEVYRSALSLIKQRSKVCKEHTMQRSLSAKFKHLTAAATAAEK
jgi:4-diphosphocytidyl-2C-methyl-D-erythritol kinase